MSGEQYSVTQKKVFMQDSRDGMETWPYSVTQKKIFMQDSRDGIVSWPYI